MDAVLTPHRSLSRKAYRLMFAAVVIANLAIAAYFVAQGAFPVAGFLGLDVLAIWIAFRLNYRDGLREERVRVGREQVHVARRDPSGAETHWIASPVWARAASDELGVTIRVGGKGLRVGSFLSPPERHEFARALDAALWRAKR